MRRIRYNLARQRALEVLDEVGHPVKDPVDIGDVAAGLGIRVVHRDMPTTVSGMLIIKQGRAVIVVNKNHPPTRQRFSIAHELGHFALHASDNATFVDEREFRRDEVSSLGTDPQEVEANTFASEILMAEQRVRARYAELAGSGDVVSKLAELFEVSAMAMSFRLQKLGLLEPMYG